MLWHWQSTSRSGCYGSLCYDSVQLPLTSRCVLVWIVVDSWNHWVHGVNRWLAGGTRHRPQIWRWWLSYEPLVAVCKKAIYAISVFLWSCRSRIRDACWPGTSGERRQHLRTISHDVYNLRQSVPACDLVPLHVGVRIFCESHEAAIKHVASSAHV